MLSEEFKLKVDNILTVIINSSYHVMLSPLNFANDICRNISFEEDLIVWHRPSELHYYELWTD